MDKGAIEAKKRKVQGPDLKKYMGKRLDLKLNAGRVVSGVLRGFDQFMNLVLDETLEHVSRIEELLRDVMSGEGDGEDA